MTDPRLQGHADLLVHYSLELKQADQVAVTGTEAALPLMKEIYRSAMLAGAHCDLFIRPSWQEFLFYSIGNDDQLSRVSRVLELAFSEYQGVVTIYSDVNTHVLSNVDPAKQAVRARAVTPLLKKFRSKTGTREIRWVGTMHPTEGFAQEADMSLDELEDFTYGAMYVDQPDPVAVWLKIRDYQEKLVNWLAGKSQVELRGPNVELELSIEGRTFLNADGKYNMPSGEIYTSPVEDSARGWIRFSLPGLLQGRSVSGIELKFEDGVVVDARSDTNQDFLEKMLDLDEGARRLGELGIGTNKRIDRFIRNILFDEKIGGTVHLALGSGFERAGGGNQSGLHWDMITELGEGGRILVDGEPFFEQGEFRIPGVESGFPVA